MNQPLSPAAFRVTDRLREIVAEIISRPDELQFIPLGTGSRVILNVQVNASDTGSVLGKGGAHFRALGTLAALMGQRAGVRLTLNRMKEPEPGERADPAKKVKLKKVWASDKVSDLLERTACSVLTHPTAVTVEDADSVTSFLTIRHSPREIAALVEALVTACEPLFNAIGKMNGRVLYVSAEAASAESQQPEKADGRFARA